MRPYRSSPRAAPSHSRRAPGSRPAAIASAASALGWPGVDADEFGAAAEVDLDQLPAVGELAVRIVRCESHTRAPGAARPSIEPGLAQCTVTVSPDARALGEEPLVAPDQRGGDQRREKRTRCVYQIEEDRGGKPGQCNSAQIFLRLICQRIGTELELDGHGPHALAALDKPRRAVAARRPQSAALPAGIRIVDAPVEALGIEADRIRHAQRDHLAVLA